MNSSSAVTPLSEKPYWVFKLFSFTMAYNFVISFGQEGYNGSVAVALSKNDLSVNCSPILALSCN